MSVLNNISELLLGGITLLSLLTRLGENNELGLELTDSLNVGGQSLVVLVSSSLVNSNTNSSGKLNRNTGLLKLSRSEPTTLPDLKVVPLSLRSNDGSQETSNRSRENLGSLGLTSLINNIRD